MRRVRIELEDIAARDNLVAAAWKAARGKRQRPDVARFFAKLNGSLEALRRAILDETAPANLFRRFTIRDPKTRVIHAACFADRVLHHAILNLAEPVFERSLTSCTYACRPGMGVHAAIAEVQAHLARWPWYVKVDVGAYFPSIDHQHLMALLERRFKGAGFLRLMRRIVAGCPAAPGKGLPIGSLTSQHCANLYLDGADRWLQACPAVFASVRYMDDIVWWCADREAAHATRAGLAAWLAAERALTLKPGPGVGRSRDGLTWCGARVLPVAVRLTARRRRRYVLRRRAWESAFAEGAIDGCALQRGYDAVLSQTLAMDASAWRREQLRRMPPAYDEDG